MRIRLAGTALLLAAPLAAQFQIPMTYVIDSIAQAALPGTVRAVSGEFNGDAVVDIATLHGFQLSITFDPGYTETSAIIPGTYWDIEARAGGGGPRDAELFAVGPQGLQQVGWSCHPNGAAISDVFDASDSAQLDAYAAWLGATMVRSGDLNGDGHADLVGVASDGVTLVAATWDATAQEFGAAGAAAPLAVAAGQVLDICLANLDGIGGAEIVVLSTVQAEVFTSTGMLFDSTNAVTVAGQLATIQDPGTNVERFAWLRNLQSGAWQVVIGRSDNGLCIADQVIDVTSLMIRTVTAALYNLDEATDLVLTNRSGDTITILNQSVNGTYPLSGPDVRTIELAVPTGTDTAMPPVLADFDHDGDTDLAYPVPGTATVFLYKNGMVDETAIAPHFIPNCSGDPNLWYTVEPGESYVLHVRFEAPSDPTGVIAPPLGSTHFWPEGATHLQVQWWTSHGTVEGQFSTDIESTYNTVIPLDAIAVFSNPSLPDVAYLQADVGFFDNAQYSVDIEYLMTRYVTVQGILDPVTGAPKNVVTAVFPHTSLYFAHVTNTAALTYLDRLPFTSGQLVVGMMDYWAAGVFSCFSDGTEPGGAGATGCVPDFPPGTPPMPPDPHEDDEPPSPPPGQQ